MNTDFKVREKIIVDSLNRGTKTLEELGTQFGISRERVSQIYYKATGVRRGILRQSRKDRAIIQKQLELAQTKFICAGCLKLVTNADGKGLQKYCRTCHNENQYKRRAMNILVHCAKCSKPFHPFYNPKSGLQRKIGYFCSKICYGSYPNRKGV